MKRRDARRVPIIAMSANSFAEDIINSRLAGMNVHLAKPLDAEKIKQTISEELRRFCIKLKLGKRHMKYDDEK